MNPLREIRIEWKRCFKPPTVVVAIIFGVVWLIVLSMVGSPRALLGLIAIRFAVLPSWLFLLLVTVLFVLCGGSLGMVFAGKRKGGDLPRYRGSFFLTIAVTFCYLWYALFFGARFFLPALLLAAGLCFCFLMAALSYRKLFRIAEACMWLAAGIGAYCLILSLFCFFLL